MTPVVAEVIDILQSIAPPDQAKQRRLRLVDDLTQVVAEGHRALVFSQFTRFLARARTRLDTAGIEHAYLDGRTRNRERAIARFEGVSSREAAEALRGQLVEIDRDALPPLEEGEYYYADLIGLTCFDQQDNTLGSVVGVENFGAGDLLDIETVEGKRSLIPYREGIADLIDARIVLDPEFLA